MIAAALILVGAADAPPVLAVARGVFADDRVTAPDPQLVWPDDASVQVDERDGEIVARFDRPLGDDRIAAFRDAGGAAIGDLRWNDDSLVLRAAAGWRMRWRQAGPVVTVTFDSPRSVSPDASPDADGARDAALIAIQADAAAGYTGQARRAAAAIVAREPGDRQAARVLADARAADGDIRGAAQGYRALGATDLTARRIMAAAPGIASIGIVARDGSDLSQAEFGARVDAAIGDRFSVGGGVRHVASSVATDTDDVRVGATVVDASVGAALTDAVRLQLLASASLDDGVTGGGYRLVAGPSEAQLRATLLRHMPDFSTPAQALAGGYLSRAAVGLTYRLTPGLVGQGEVGVNRYGLAGLPGASDSITASGGLDYILQRQFPTLGLSYRFEAEYVERMRIAADGQPLIALADRENHTLQGLVGATFGAMQVTGLAGWTIDRFGGDGPTASLGIAAPVAVAWRVEGSAGITSISRPGFSGRQLFARALLSHSLGDGR